MNIQDQYEKWEKHQIEHGGEISARRAWEFVWKQFQDRLQVYNATVTVPLERMRTYNDTAIEHEAYLQAELVRKLSDEIALKAKVQQKKDGLYFTMRAELTVLKEDE
jgi:penicillin-binding protein-related factor A (putative recombinase)